MATEVTSTAPPRRLAPPKAVWWVIGIAAVIGLLALGIKTGVCDNKFSSWVAFFITGLRLGALYAMIALGYTMVYGVLQLINFAHSEVFMVGSFAGLYALSKIFGITSTSKGFSGISLYFALAVALILAALAAGGVAVLLERVAYRPLRRRGVSRLNYLITAIGASLFLSNLFFLLDGKKHLGLPFNWPKIAGPAFVLFPNVMNAQVAFTLFGVKVTNKDLLVFGVSILILVALDQFVRRSRTGKGIRAVAEDPETALLMGVNVDRVIVATFFIGGLMAGAAGLMWGVYFGQTQFNVGFLPGIKAFTAAVLGGIGNIRGAMLGGLLLGVVENVGVACTGLRWQQVIAFLVLVGVLMFRPTGLLGEQVGKG
jgi:branched-chain amino acid transport system permease protein